MSRFFMVHCVYRYAMTAITDDVDCLCAGHSLVSGQANIRQEA